MASKQRHAYECVRQVNQRAQQIGMAEQSGRTGTSFLKRDNRPATAQAHDLAEGGSNVAGILRSGLAGLSDGLSQPVP